MTTPSERNLTWSTKHNYGANSLAHQFPSFQVQFLFLNSILHTNDIVYIMLLSNNYCDSWYLKLIKNMSQSSKTTNFKSIHLLNPTFHSTIDCIHSFSLKKQKPLFWLQFKYILMGQPIKLCTVANFINIHRFIFN